MQLTYSAHIHHTNISLTYTPLTMNTTTDTPVDPLVKDFITRCHDQAVGGAVNSDDEEDAMEVTETASVGAVSDAPDTPLTCGAVGNSACVCGQCDYKHYVALVAKQPEVSGHIFNTHPCNLPLGNVAFKQDAKPAKKPPRRVISSKWSTKA
jgi:hypothetical protein